MESGHVSVSIVKGCFETPAWAILPDCARCHSNHTTAPVQSSEEMTWTPSMSRALLVICMQINYRSKPNLNLWVADWVDNGICCKFMSLWWRALVRAGLQDPQRVSGSVRPYFVFQNINHWQNTLTYFRTSVLICYLFPATLKLLYLCNFSVIISCHAFSLTRIWKRIQNPSRFNLQITLAK
jgi:hypothetical protein